jgi:hypothetical protein
LLPCCEKEREWERSNNFELKTLFGLSLLRPSSFPFKPYPVPLTTIHPNYPFLPFPLSLISYLQFHNIHRFESLNLATPMSALTQQAGNGKGNGNGKGTGGGGTKNGKEEGGRNKLTPNNIFNSKLLLRSHSRSFSQHGSKAYSQYKFATTHWPCNVPALWLRNIENWDSWRAMPALPWNAVEGDSLTPEFVVVIERPQQPQFKATAQ